MDAFSLREDELYNFFKIIKISNKLLLFIIHGEYQRLEKRESKLAGDPQNSHNSPNGSRSIYNDKIKTLALLRTFFE